MTVFIVVFSLLGRLQTQGTQTTQIPAVTIQVRFADGTAFDRPLHIRSDEGEPLQSCTPDASGRCTVSLQRGLYLIEPENTALDLLSATGAVEIGGRWLGITVGDEAVFYGFVIEEDKVYFDVAPDEPQPQPIRPKQADLDAHFAPESAELEASPIQPLIPLNEQQAVAAGESADFRPKTSSAPFRWHWIVLPLLPLIIFTAWAWRSARQTKQTK